MCDCIIRACLWPCIRTCLWPCIRACLWPCIRLCSFVNECLNRNEETQPLLTCSSSEEPEQSTARSFKEESEPLLTCSCSEESEPLPARSFKEESEPLLTSSCSEESEPQPARSFKEESEPLLPYPLYNKLERNDKAEPHLTHSEPRDQSKCYLPRSEGPAEPHLTYSEQSEPVLCSNCNRNLGLKKSQLKSPNAALTIRCQK